jgi:hypothetical protein
MRSFGRLGGNRSRTASILQRARSLRIAPGRAHAPTRSAFGRRPGGVVASFRYSRMARGGFFKDVFKGVKKIVKTVTKVPVIGTIAKAAVGSLPIVGQVTTAVAAFKKKTPVGAAASPVGGVQPSSSVAVNMAANAPAPRRRRKAAKKSKRRKATTKRKGGGSAKQRAARARFAAAARKGRIKKGARL